MTSKIPYIWDYDIDEDKLKDILSGKVSMGHIDRKWAIIRLLEYAPYNEIIKLIGYREIIKQWPELRKYIRSQSRRRGFDFLVEWLQKKHPDKIQ
ncbi:MAG: hypothetical protein HYS70_01100 [Nitrospinae bacterium]|nr:hypothetical protein [Nitrospinota bacterium]